MRFRKLAVAVLMSIASAGLSAIAQAPERNIKTALAWTSPDGGVHLTVPAGWFRDDEFMRWRGFKLDPTLVLNVSKGDPALDTPDLICKVKIIFAGPQPAGATQATFNNRALAQADKIDFVGMSKRMIDGVAVVEGVVSAQPRLILQVLAIYLHAKNIYVVDTQCMANRKDAIQPEDIKTAHLLLDSLNFTP